MTATSPIFQSRVVQEKREVLKDVLSLLKLRRARADAPGARIAAIGEVQAVLEQMCAELPVDGPNGASGAAEGAAA